MNYQEFYKLLSNNRLIAPIWEFELDLVNNEIKENKKKEDLLFLIAIYFSLIDDGNIAMSLDKDILSNKWNKKLNGVYELIRESDDFIEDDFNLIRDESTRVINNIDVIKEDNFKEIIGKGNDKKIFEIDNGYIYVKKYNHARLSIKNSVKDLFSRSNSISADLDFIKHIKTKSGNPFILSNGQLDIVKNGVNNNLIITGGPGTGKTSSVLFTLFALLLHKVKNNPNIYMVAPSGKASSRIKESVEENISLFEESFRRAHKDIFEALSKVKASTIHALLNNNQDGSFKYNRNNKLDSNSIIIIDEASMIDICIFAALLEAIPNDAIVFILGDKNQLPSVESGAVFGELLKMKELAKYKVELDESIRFSQDTDIFKLADEINNNKPITYKNDWKEVEDFNIEPMNSKLCPVYFYKYNEQGKNKDNVEKIISKWASEYYVRLQKASYNLDPTNIKALDDLFELTKDAKILTAENESYRGVKYINAFIKKRYISQDFKKLFIGDYPGLLMMVNTNNKFLNLNNGDSGILVTFKDDPTLYFMIDKVHPRIEKEEKVDSAIFRLGKYTFYPITSLKADEIDLAFAITIHKSQGSDYNNILVILPNRPGHPLLSKQIIYTAITRTKGNTYILSSKDRFEEAKENFIERDTNIA